MSTIDRPVLGSLSTNTILTRNQDSLKRPTLPRLKSVIPQISISKPQSPKVSITNATKLKYRLQLAYYKLRTDQISVPINDLMKNLQTSKSNEKPISKTTINNPRKTAVTPSLTRHISLLAASTPLHDSTNKNYPKKVTFMASKNPSETATFLKPRPFNIENLNKKETLRTSSSPNLRVTDRTVKVGDLVHANIPLGTDDTTIADNDATISNIDITPIKGRRLDDKGELLLSSPTKKIFPSTPGSYGAAKSLLQLSLISSN